MQEISSFRRTLEYKKYVVQYITEPIIKLSEVMKTFFTINFKFLENVDCGVESIKIPTDDAKCTLNFFPLLLLVCMSGTCFAEFR